jgi:hypothetical protein
LEKRNNVDLGAAGPEEKGQYLEHKHIIPVTTTLWYGSPSFAPERLLRR